MGLVFETNLQNASVTLDPKNKEDNNDTKTDE
jgi:hypothetical protein